MIFTQPAGTIYLLKSVEYKTAVTISEITERAVIFHVPRAHLRQFRKNRKVRLPPHPVRQLQLQKKGVHQARAKRHRKNKQRQKLRLRREAEEV